MEDKKRELREETERFVDRNFNFIQLGVYEREAEHEGLMLMEFIQAEEFDILEAKEWFDSQDTEDKANLLEQEFGVDEPTPEFYEYLTQDYRNEIEEYFGRENYPMWNTLFEFRSEPPAEWIEKAKKCGFGVIDAFGEFNTTLFVSGCGYSFYGQHWIPLFLECIYGQKEKYAGIDYSDQ